MHVKSHKNEEEKNWFYLTLNLRLGRARNERSKEKLNYWNEKFKTLCVSYSISLRDINKII
jgi:hypothetical protein